MWESFTEALGAAASSLGSFVGGGKKRGVTGAPAGVHRGRLAPAPAPSPRTLPSRGRKRQREQLEAHENVRASLSKENIDAILHNHWTDAYVCAQADGREYLREHERNELLDKCRVLLQNGNYSWNALRKRVERICNNGTPARKPGSGRPTTWTQEIAEAAATKSREFDGVISRSELYLLVEAELGDEKMCCRTVFMENLRKTFKRRRIRYKPSLTEDQKAARVNFANYHIGNNFADQPRTLFVDEKRFEAMATGVYNLPKEDDTPRRSIQSKSNSPFVMVLVALVEPRGDFNGVVGMHAFTETIAAARNSHVREAGTMVEKPTNVTGESYLQGWTDSILPALKRCIDGGHISRPTRRAPLILQDDNARPHRAIIGGKSVLQLICEAAKNDFQIELVPAQPLQPAQSPDCNPLDSFVFRVLGIKFRRNRAMARVRYLSDQRVHRRVVDVSEQSEQGDEDPDLGLVGMDEGDDDVESDAGEGDVGDDYQIRRTVPLRCKPNDGARCPGCRNRVNFGSEGTQCDLRQSWWHDSCAEKLCDSELYQRSGRVKKPGDVAHDEPWICPQCAVHLCSNDSRSEKLCVMCWKPSNRNGDDMGSDMIPCDRDCGGLFHKSCVGYNQETEVAAGRDHWYCVACDTLIDGDEYVPLDQIEDPVEMSSSSVTALKLGVQQALDECGMDFFVRGFETRKEVIRKIAEAEGTHNYDMHWRHGKE